MSGDTMYANASGHTSLSKGESDSSTFHFQSPNNSTLHLISPLVVGCLAWGVHPWPHGYSLHLPKSCLVLSSRTGHWDLSQKPP